MFRMKLLCIGICWLVAREAFTVLISLHCSISKLKPVPSQISLQEKRGIPGVERNSLVQWLISMKGNGNRFENRRSSP